MLLLDGQLDNHFVGLLENKNEGIQLVRVDSDVTDNLIKKDDHTDIQLSAADRSILTQLFDAPTRKVEKSSFTVQFEQLSATAEPVVLTQNEYMRRMKEMAAMQPGMSFYGELPDSYTIVVNTAHPLVEALRAKANVALAGTVQPFLDTIDASNKVAEEARSAAGTSELTPEARQTVDNAEKAVSDARAAMEKAIADYAPQAPEASQLVDLALLANGLLRGEALSKFIARSYEMMK